MHIPNFFFGILTLKSSAIKANSVHRRLSLEIMYSKGCLATGCDAGKAFLHRGESNGVPNALERGVSHKWAGWLHNPCRLGSHRFRAGNVPQVGQVAT